MTRPAVIRRGGFVARPAFRGYRAGYYPYARPIYRGGYYPYARPAYRYPYRYRYPYYSGYPYYGGYYRTYDDTGAVVAGLIGGLALGAIASAATRPVYRSATYAPYNRCFYERRRIATRSGHAIVRRVRTCY